MALALAGALLPLCSQAAVLIDANTLNGSFELLGGATNSTAKATHWDTDPDGDVDDWTVWGAAVGGPSTAENDSGAEESGGATDGVKVGFMQGGNAVYNLTTNIVAAGTRYGIQWDAINGFTDYEVSLVYSPDAGATVTNIPASVLFSTGTGNDQGGGYTIPAGHPAIGNPIGIGIYAPTGWVNIDNVRLSINEDPGGVLPLDPFTVVSIAVSGGTATLTWESEAGATYTILSKTRLTDASWSTAKDGISSTGDTTTSDSVSVGAADE